MKNNLKESGLKNGRKPSEGNASFFQYALRRIGISDLVPHEGTLDWHLNELKDLIAKDGHQARPIAVSSLESMGLKWHGKFIIHDGHHRTKALRTLGCSFVMCSVFDYADPRIKVFDYRTASIPISKEAVIQRAILGTEIVPRFDKHFIEIDGKLSPFHNNSIIEPEVNTDLSQLMQP